ncbi:HCNGP-domain-containing protein [Mycena indigotica]|uniref:HCNGP-domain-containing protein n=1 Tax=Mycena indigotica TaxID=2126181 RepID=A0A8H6TE53_9AGAR|nr:HCNGP-domain-containing protein [Mycena indigotica]KAF7316028.1 HCNGP-domain-containing protein [Mycena indigotica]
MLPGLAAYGDDSDTEPTTRSSPPHRNGPIHDTATRAQVKGGGDATRKLKSQLVIKRPPTTHKAHPRASTSGSPQKPAPPLSTSSTPRNTPTADDNPSSDTKPNTDASSSSVSRFDELTRIRELLRPAPIPGLVDWGIPPAPDGPCDPAMEAKLAQFHALKHADPPKHFNDSLMGSRAFRNPHLYAKLVEFVAADERATNFPSELWDLGNIGGEEGWDAEKIGMSFSRPLLSIAEYPTRSGTPGKRTQIQFTSGKPSQTDRERYHPYAREKDKEREGKTRWG